jgi:hypothetical protein
MRTGVVGAGSGLCPIVSFGSSTTGPLDFTTTVT